MGAELLYHATCRADPQKVDLLRRWATERVWEFLDLSEALEMEATRLEWKKGEFSPSSSAPPIHQVTTPKLMSVPLRSTAEIPSRRATKPYPERDSFRKRSAILAAKVAQRLAKDKAGHTCLLTEGAGEVSGATRTLAVELQLSKEDFLCFVRRAQERLARICFGLDDRTLWCYLLLWRSAQEEIRVCICLLCGVLSKRLALGILLFELSLSIERRVCSFFQDVVDENGNEGFLEEDSIYQAH
jgi:hypothetical protein